jgi:hypothetical protein
MRNDKYLGLLRPAEESLACYTDGDRRVTLRYRTTVGFYVVTTEWMEASNSLMQHCKEYLELAGAVDGYRYSVNEVNPGHYPPPTAMSLRTSKEIIAEVMNIFMRDMDTRLIRAVHGW